MPASERQAMTDQENAAWSRYRANRSYRKLEEFAKAGIEADKARVAFEKLKAVAPYIAPRKRKFQGLRKLLWVMFVWPIFVCYVAFRKDDSCE